MLLFAQFTKGSGREVVADCLASVVTDEDLALEFLFVLLTAFSFLESDNQVFIGFVEGVSLAVEPWDVNPVEAQSILVLGSEFVKLVVFVDTVSKKNSRLATHPHLYHQR